MSKLLKVVDDSVCRSIRSEGYNFDFSRSNGFMRRWGVSSDDDPDFSPFGPEILDIEISTTVNDVSSFNGDRTRLVRDGGCSGKCPWCYKSNSGSFTYNMTFDEFRHVLDSFLQRKDGIVPSSPLTQLAFGVMDIRTNPDLFRMAEYARSVGVVPNITINGLEPIDKDLAMRMKKAFGSVAVSVYDKARAYSAASSLIEAGCSQVNFHLMYCMERFDFISSVIDELSEGAVPGLNAVVLLALKKKGLGSAFTRLSDELFDALVSKSVEMNSMSLVRIGFDSCTCSRFLDSYKRLGHDCSAVEIQCEPCEACCFSSYVNAFCEYFPCSFCEGCHGWEHGMKVGEDFMDIWKSKRVGDFRASLISNGRKCPVYEV